ncbi:MAG: PorV/PorQ family protein [Bacteroidota bacterium]|nr:PorV/PorQ family protein [Bacteroidota bacterium]
MNHKKYITAILAIAITGSVFAGNPDRRGTNGGEQLLINPWARSNGWASANTANVKGIEATWINVAGLSYTKQTELVFSHTRYLAGININNFGLSQVMGKNGGVIGFSLMNINSGDIQRTTFQQPEGGLGTYTVQFTNLAMSYAKKFSEKISGGMLVRFISEGTAEVTGSTMTLDAGVQYQTATSNDEQIRRLKGNDFKLGISVKNIGPDISYAGDGMSVRTQDPSKPYSSTTQQRSAKDGMPSVVNIGMSYDFRFDKGAEVYFNRLTLAGSFTSHSYQDNTGALGLEYAYKNFFMLRSGMLYQQGIFSADTRNTAYTGFHAGFTLELPFGKNKSSFALDYSFKQTKPFGNMHTFGVRMDLGGKDND